MCNKDHLVAYLYDELSSSDKAVFEAHITECAACRHEVDELRLTRHHLTTWSPPEPEFNFTVVQTTRPAAAVRSKWPAFVPRWALATAATLLVLAGAAAIANVEIRYERDGSLVVRTGWSAAPVESVAGVARPQPSSSPAPAVAAASEEMRTDVPALQRRLQELEQSVQQSLSADRNRTIGSTTSAISAAELRKILAESEARQRTELAVHIGQIWKDFTAARVSDWARVQQTLGQAQGLTNAHLRQQRESIDSLRYLQISQQK
jgi:anti-sigma factor RsiW